MAVPALTTADIATFTYWRQTSCTYVQLADVLSILHSYHQYAEYVDGTIKIFDTGSESAAPNNYVLVNVRIRADGWIMAWFPRTLMTGTADSGSGVVVTDTVMEITRNGETSAGSVAANELAGYTFKPTSGPLSGNEYCIKSNTITTITLHDKYGDNVSTDMATLGTASYNILGSRGNLTWWGHTASASGDPTAQSTRLGRALYEMWETLKTNQQGGSGAVLDYADVGYWDYEYTSSAYLYIFGYSVYRAQGAADDQKDYYATVPSGVTLYSAVLNYGGSANEGGAYQNQSRIRGYLEAVLKYEFISAQHNVPTNGFVNIDQTSIMSVNYGIRKTIQCWSTAGPNTGQNCYNNQSVVLLTSG